MSMSGHLPKISELSELNEEKSETKMSLNKKFCGTVRENELPYPLGPSLDVEVPSYHMSPWANNI